MKKSTVWFTVMLFAAGVMSGAATAYGWHSHEEYIEKTKIEI